MTKLKFNCLKEVNDDWYPNIDGKYVTVSLYEGSPESLVCVWGNDDCGMEYIGEDAEYMFHRLLEEPVLNRKVCEKIGLGAC
jgi:hypothetical protein